MALIIRMILVIEMEWIEFIRIREWSPLASLNIDMEIIIEGRYKISDNQYLLSSPCNKDFIDAANGPFVTALVWACSEGAFRRVYLAEIEKDDGNIVSPPDEILPEAGKYTYRKIHEGLVKLNCKGILETASYRIATDGAFLNRSIESEIASYHFRGREYDDEEEPFVITWNLILYR